MRATYVATSIGCAPVASDVARHDGIGPTTAGAYSVGMLSALMSAGYAYRVGPGLCLPTDVPERAEHRAVVLERCLPVGAIAVVHCAAWLHAGGPFPARLDVVMSGRRRPTPPPEHLRLRYLPLPLEDRTRIGSITVTTVPRTAADVAALLPAEEALPLLGRLHAATGFAPAEAIAALGPPGRRRHARALELLRTLMDPDHVVDRRR